MGDAKTLAIAEVEKRTAVGALNLMICDHPIAAGCGRFTASALLYPFAAPACPPAYGETPSPMLWRQQLGISLLG